MTVQQFNEWCCNCTVLSSRLDLHAAYGLSARVFLLERDGKRFEVLHTYDPTTDQENTYEILDTEFT